MLILIFLWCSPPSTLFPYTTLFRSYQSRRTHRHVWWTRLHRRHDRLLSPLLRRRDRQGVVEGPASCVRQRHAHDVSRQRRRQAVSRHGRRRPSQNHRRKTRRFSRRLHPALTPRHSTASFPPL